MGPARPAAYVAQEDRRWDSAMAIATESTFSDGIHE